jgi:hypothetical protein
MNKSQFEALEKFKEKILKENLLTEFGNYDDLYLLRFLRARKFDVEKSFLMFSNFLKWRKDLGVDNIKVSLLIIIILELRLL